MRKIANVALELTTVCNRACENCCAAINMGIRPAVHHTAEYFERAAKFLHGIERIHVTGGEPLTHPLFDRFARSFRELFGCSKLTLQTNGFQAETHAGALQCFDEVFPSLYGPENRAQVAFIQALIPGPVWSEGEAGFTPRSRRGSGKICFRGESDTVAYADGKLYGCCVAPGIPGAIGIELTPDWRERILETPLPCADCWFSE